KKTEKDADPFHFPRAIMSWPMLLIEKHYPWQYPPGTKKERDFKYDPAQVSRHNRRIYCCIPSRLTRAARCWGIGLARASYWSFKHRPIADREIRWSLSEECVL